MSIELLQTLSLVSYIVAAVLVLTAIALFFLLDIKKVIGDVSGSTARKAIENIRQQNAAGGDNAYKPNSTNAAKGKHANKSSQSGMPNTRVNSYSGSVATSKLDTTQLSEEARRAMEQGGSSETTVLNFGNETTILSASSDSTGETTVLSPEELNFGNTAIPEDKYFKVDVEMGFTGSSEIIE